MGPVGPVFSIYMARDSVSGKTEAELADLREEFDRSNKADHYEFEEWYCLARIPRQPDEYDGPQRYCISTELKKRKLCKFHGGATHGNPSKLEDPRFANLKHGMKAARETLMAAMDREGNEWQRDLYNWVVEEWPEAYGIEVDNDPQAEYAFHALAIEIVRAERAEGYILGEGEKGQKKIFGPDGSVHYEDVPHYLADMMQRQRKLVMRMENELGISRKARQREDSQADVTDLVKSFAEVGASLIQKADKEYDPEEFDPDL